MPANDIHPVRLTLMQVGYGLPSAMPFVAYLVTMSDGTQVLIDSGLPDVLPRPEELPPNFEVVRGASVAEQLATIGLTPDDIDILVCTHFDFDHCGQNPAFTRAQYVVQRSHFASLAVDHRYDKTRAQWDLPRERYWFIDGDTELFPGLDLIETSGHSIGHQSARIRLPNTGPVLLTVDAVGTSDRFNTEYEGRSVDSDRAASMVSTRKLLALVEREPSTLVIFGHDVPQWAALKKLPQFYD
jgi:N-acyl homoserine lactone hydrolase